MSAKDVAATIYDYWTLSGHPDDPIKKPALSHLVAVCVIGCQEGEYSLEWPPGQGDGGKAHGIGQWHDDRVKIILDNTGIDVRSAGLLDQNRAMFWEIWNKLPACKKALLAATNVTEGIAALVNKFEFSGNRQRDIRRRSQYAGYWDVHFTNAG
jgi:hypothetical protein